MQQVNDPMTCAGCSARLACGRDGQVTHPSPCRSWKDGWRPGGRPSARLPGLPFLWHAAHAGHMLPPRWQADALRTARDHAEDVTIIPSSVTSREDNLTPLATHTVTGTAVAKHLPWLDDGAGGGLYRREFRALVQRTADQPVLCARPGAEYGVNLNVQYARRGQPAESYEAHADSQEGWQGLLYFVTLPPGAGGELRMANRPGVTGRAAVDADCSVIYPAAGTLIWFPAWYRYTHYVTPLNLDWPGWPSLLDAAGPDVAGLLGGPDEVIRVAAAFNWYRPGGEALREPDLDDHLGLATASFGRQHL